MKKTMPRIRTLIVKSEQDFERIKRFCPEADTVRSLKWVELRLPSGVSFIVNDRGYERFRVEIK